MIYEAVFDLLVLSGGWMPFTTEPIGAGRNGDESFGAREVTNPSFCWSSGAGSEVMRRMGDGDADDAGTTTSSAAAKSGDGRFWDSSCTGSSESFSEDLVRMGSERWPGDMVMGVGDDGAWAEVVLERCVGMPEDGNRSSRDGSGVPRREKGFLTTCEGVEREDPSEDGGREMGNL